MNNLIILNLGDAVRIDGKKYYYVGIDHEMKYNNLPCVFLATDPDNWRTNCRYSIEYLMQRGYSCMIKVKYTHMLYNRANPFGKLETHITKGAPVARPDYMNPGSNDTIYLKKDNYIYFVEPENIIKFYNA